MIIIEIYRRQFVKIIENLVKVEVIIVENKEIIME